MPIRVQCPQCGKEYNVGDDKAGRRFQCKGCQASVVVPAAAAINEDDPFTGMDEDFSAGFMSQGTKPTSGNRSTTGKKGKGKSDSSGSGAALGIGIGVVAMAVIAAGVFFFMRGGDGDEPAPAGGGGNNAVANANNDNATSEGTATPGPSGNTPAGNTPAGGTGNSGMTIQATPARAPTGAELDATLNQLKQIILGMHNYHDTLNSFPVSSNASNSLGPDGKPFLSWRVHLLPFLDQMNLYNQFHLNEPWDSPHNLPLADLLPAIYRSPGDEPDATTTRFVVFSGPTAPFADGIGKRFADFRDGTSYTILVAHVPAGRAVPWTKPEDAAFDAADPLASIGGAIPPEGLPVAMADGACFFLNPETDTAMFANFVQPADSQIADYELLLDQPANFVPFVPPTTPPTGPLHLAYMPDDCIGLVRIAPRTIMQTSWLTGSLPPEMTANAPVPLDRLEEAIFWIVPRSDAPIPAEPDSQFALSFTQPTTPAELPLSQTYDGNAYVHGTDTVVFVKDDRFEQMFAGIGTGNPLPGSLRTPLLDADVFMAFQLQSPNFSIDWSEAQFFLLGAGDLGNGLMQAEQVQMAFRANESPLIEAWLTFPDDVAATSYKTALEEQIPQMLESQTNDPVGGALATVLTSAWSVRQEGSSVSLEIAHSDALTAELASIVSALMTPAVMHNPERIPRQITKNNFRQILLAAHNYHEAFNSFPVPTSNEQYFDEDGKPLLSWRVHLLPYLEEAELYQEFHFDEPWDSEHNIQLLERMPAVFQIEDGYSADLEPGMTRIVRADGEGALFHNGRGAQIRDITDGLSNTAFCFAVGPDHAVAWTKPEDIVIDFSQPIMPQLGLPEGENFFVGMCDGVAAEVLPTIDDENLRRLLQHNDSEVAEIPFAP